MNLIHYRRGLCLFLKDSRSLKGRMFKCMLFMKLIIALLAITFQVSARAYSQQITLSYKNAPLASVMRSIFKQSGYSYTLPPNSAAIAKPVTINLKATSIGQTLLTLFANQPFDYKVEGRLIMIQVKVIEQKKSDSTANDQRLQDIEGVVRNHEGKPIERATVVLKGTNRGAITDASGNFYFKDVPPSGTLIITIIGHETVEVTYQNGVVPVIVLKEINADLREVVIVNKGYYTQKEELNTGSVGTLSAAEISRQPISNPLTALQGRLPGIYISQTSGVPGAALNINIRGQNSLRLDANDPLYIVDGIPFSSKTLAQTPNASYNSQLSPFTNIRPEDIETIDVLRDADATAIYGSRGANGVILITTRKGKAGKTHVDLNVYKGTGKVTRFLNLMNTQQYLEMRGESYKNDKRNPFLFERDINKSWSPDNNIDRYTDWQKLLIDGTADVTNASASISGGSESLQYLAGLSYRKETTVFPGDFANKLGSANLSVTHTSENKRLQINTTFNYSVNNNKLPTIDFTPYIFTAPNAPALYDENGKLNFQNNTFNNPLRYLNQKSTSLSENFLGNFSATYRILEGLQFKANVGYTTTRFNDKNLIPYSSILPYLSPAANYRSISLGTNDGRSWITEPQLTYNKTFKNHHIDALIGTTFQAREQSGTTQSGIGFSSDILLENIAAAQYKDGNSSYSQYRYNAIFGRIGYTYADKYILNLTGRRDGSSRFGPGEQFGNFYALGAAWIFTKEHWMSRFSQILNYGKLRGSIGKTGNDQINDYRYLTGYYSLSGYYGTSGLQVGNIGNPYYRWETIDKIEAALELGFFNNILKFNSAYYKNRTQNQLVDYALPGVSGFTSITANLPAIIQNSGLEFDLSATIFNNTMFRWTTSANVTIQRNKLVAYPNLEGSSYGESYRVGEPITGAMVFKYTGIDKTTGLYTFEDFNKDDNLNGDDRYMQNMQPKFYGGINNSFSYKGISLDIFFQFTKKMGQSFAGITRPGGYIPEYAGANMPVELLDRWRAVGDDATYQKFSTDGASNAAFNRYIGSDAGIIDASYIRLKNISLSWQLPKSWMDKISFNAIRMYLQGQNLLTFTNFKGLDPETTPVGSSITLPTQRILTVGLQISL